MTTQPNDGGPAFACAMPAAPPSHDFEWQPGMSLLDFFAGLAMQGLVSRDYFVDSDTVRRAYDIAELMLEEKELRNETPAP